jgi:pyruvate formate lyase activating enzyme
MSQTGVIFEIREFCLHDGPGIRTTVFFKGCPLRCAWCHNPEGFAPEPQLLVNRAACTGCGACRAVCRHADRCVACGACVPVCPQGCRRLCGRRVSAEALAAELRQNEAFFLRYGGGLTFSGGEPLRQAAFLVALAERLRPVHLAVETSGYAPPEAYRRVAGAVDLVIQDLKHPDPAAHRRYTGVEVGTVLENLAWLKASGRPFVARIPLIPGVNDAPETLERFAELLQGASGLTEVELLPYHLAAGAKYALLGLAYEPPFDPARAAHADPAPFLARGLACRVR